MTFSSGVVVVSGAFGGSLNELDFPPAPPGQAVFLNESDVTSVQFANPISSFSGLFTYGGPLTLNIYGVGSSLLTTLTSAFTTNVGSAGDPGSMPNEFLSSDLLANAVRMEILAPNTDFTIDNLTFEATSIVPEPGTMFVTVMTGTLLYLGRRRTSRRTI